MDQVVCFQQAARLSHGRQLGRRLVAGCGPEWAALGPGAPPGGRVPSGPVCPEITLGGPFQWQCHIILAN